jgi:hypothetical protein
MRISDTFINLCFGIFIGICLLVSKDVGSAGAIVFAIYWHRYSQLKGDSY